MSWAIESGAAESTDLSGLGVVLAGRYDDDEPGSPWTYVLYIDERADSRQLAALTAIFTGQLGGTPQQQFPWVWKPSELLEVSAVPIEIRHEPQRGWFRVRNRVTLRIRGPVEDQEPVTCVIPGHHRSGTELYADLLNVGDPPLEFELSGKCAYESTFEYSSEDR